jgi:serine/alanine adding enzyme
VIPDKALRITPLAGRFAEWEQFVSNNPSSTFCHRAGWFGVMTDVMRQQCEFLVAEGDGGVWRGVLPLVHVKGLLGHYLVSMPFLDDGGPIGDPLARGALADEAVAVARKSGAKLLELRARESVDASLAQNARKVSVQLGLPASAEVLWEKTFKAKLRSQVRRPSKEGMVARFGGDQAPAFYSVFARNMRDLGTPVLPRKFFEALRTSFADDVVFTVVYSADGAPAAASCAFLWKGEMYVTWASSLREYNPLAPNMLLYASMMEEGIRRGAKVFNFGRSTPGAPTHRFKMQWGGVDHALPWATWSPSTHSATPTPDKKAFKIATGIWRRLPVVVTNRIGPVLSRQIP